MFDKNEAPTVPDGYGISVAYACLLAIVHSISESMKHEKKAENGEMTPKEGAEDSDSDKNLQVQLVVSSWCGLLAALVPLIESRFIHLLLLLLSSATKFLLRPNKTEKLVKVFDLFDILYK